MLIGRLINSSLGVSKSKKVVMRGTPRNMFSVLFWNSIMIMKVVVYTFNVVLLIKEKFIFTTSESGLNRTAWG